MKCFEVERKLDSLLDADLKSVEKQAIFQHCEQCESCRKTYSQLQKLQNVSRSLATVLPAKSFDRHILQAFENHHQPQQTESFWKKLWLPIPVFASILALFTFGTFGAFWLGRTTASPLIGTETVTVEKEVEKVVEKIVVEKSKPEIVTITKYVEVPVIKEVTRYVSTPKVKNEAFQAVKNSTVVKSDNSLNKNAFITEIDFENFQPVSELKMKIIKKGENNE